jgi:hypothetical protein
MWGRGRRKEMAIYRRGNRRRGHGVQEGKGEDKRGELGEDTDNYYEDKKVNLQYRIRIVETDPPIYGPFVYIRGRTIQKWVKIGGFHSN